MAAQKRAVPGCCVRNGALPGAFRTAKWMLQISQINIRKINGSLNKWISLDINHHRSQRERKFTNIADYSI